MAFGFYRGIWITLRAANYTSQAMNDAAKGLNKVQQAQVRLAKSSVQLGLMYVAMGSMALQGMIGIMQFSERGEQLMADFSESIQPALIRLADAFANILEQVLPVITAFLNLVTAHPVITQITAVVALFGATILIGYGIVKAFTGAVTLLGMQFGFLSGQTTGSQLTLAAWIPTAKGATLASLTLASALRMVALSAGAGLAIFLILEPLVGGLPAALFGLAAAVAVLAIQLWMAAGAMSVLTWGMAAIAGAAALAGVIAMAAGATEYQMGTTFARKTGLAMVHQGEVVFDPARQRPREVFNDLTRGRGGGRSDINVTIENLYTKSDVDELDDRFARIGRRHMRSNR